MIKPKYCTLSLCNFQLTGKCFDDLNNTSLKVLKLSKLPKFELKYLLKFNKLNSIEYSYAVIDTNNYNDLIKIICRC